MTLRSLVLGIAMVVVAVGWSSSPADAATAREQLEKAVAKSAQDGTLLPEKPKGACVCISSTVPQVTGKAGYLLRVPLSGGGVTRIDVSCQVYGFDANGNVNAQTNCEDFIALPK